MTHMGVVALVSWLLTGGFGLYLLAIWLIEYDREFQSATRTRLPIPVIAGHVLLALIALAVWSAYLFLDRRSLAITAVLILLVAVGLGLTLAARWLRVYREEGPAPAGPAPASASRITAGGVAFADMPGRSLATASSLQESLRQTGPPERNFPPAVVIAHGIFALATLILIALTAIGVHL
jgi:hypothetical protein